MSNHPAAAVAAPAPTPATASLADAWVERLALLHEQASVVEPAQFRRRALRELLLDLDGTEAAWVCGLAREARVHDCVHVLREGSPWPCRGGAESPGLALDAFAAPEWRPGSIVSRGMESTSGLTTSLVIRRAARQPAFSMQQLLALQLAASHLRVAWRTCQLLGLQRRAAVTAGGGVMAIVDRHGHLHVADRQFLAVLRRGWPNWSGPRLPEPLCVLLAGAAPVGVTPAGAAPVIVAGQRWSATRDAELTFLTATPLGMLAQLTERERAAAIALLAGNPYADCARQLGISPNTLRNTIARVYRKLRVSGKLELAQRVGFGGPARGPQDVQ